MRARDVYYRAFQAWHFRFSIARLRSLERKLPAPLTRLAIPFLYRGAGYFRRIRPIQSQWEIGELYQRALRQRPRVVLEIGTCHGGTLYMWCQAAHPQAVIVSIDLPGGQFGGGYPECRADFYRAFALEQQRLHLLRADSHSPETLEAVRRVLEGRPVDFLFIDADHTYAGVKQDYALYSQLVAPGGLIALHDVGPSPTDPAIEVPRFWQELRSDLRNTTEWLDPTPNGRRIGIGMVELPV
jgi:predicted O-methyltransferase YrrM